jgi:hypothetical protein
MALRPRGSIAVIGTRIHAASAPPTLRALAPLAYAREIVIRYAGSTVDPDASA